MATYIFAFRTPTGSDALANLDEAARAGRMQAWGDWSASIEHSVLDHGNPVASVREVGDCGDGTRIGGYTLITAEDFDAAVALAQGCPLVGNGGGVEVGHVVSLEQLASAQAAAATAN